MTSVNMTGMQINNVKQKVKYKRKNYISASIHGFCNGAATFVIFATYALAYWFGYKLMNDEPDNYDIATTIAVSIFKNFTNILVYQCIKKTKKIDANVFPIGVVERTLLLYNNQRVYLMITCMSSGSSYTFEFECLNFMY